MRILKVIGLLLEYPDELLWENRDDALALVRADVPSLTPFVGELLTAPLLDRQAESVSYTHLDVYKRQGETFANGHGQVYNNNRDWEDSYRQRWQFDKIVRSTHGVNCTGSCSWKIYVKNGLVTWETQQTDYPRTRPDLPNHEPRGCPRGASYSWYLYSANRLKYPLARKRLIELWREALAQHPDPVLAWDSICLLYTSGF